MRAGQPEELEAPEPWERQPHEPDKAFAYFRMYRDLPAGRRSLRALAVSLAQQQGRNESTVFRQLCELSRVWQWHARCSAADQDLDRQTRKGMLRRHRATVERAQQILALPVAVMIELLRADPLLPKQLAAALLSELRSTRPGLALASYDSLLSLIAKTALASAQLIPVERLSRGMSMTNAAVGLTVEVFDGDTAQAHPRCR